MDILLKSEKLNVLPVKSEDKEVLSLFLFNIVFGCAT
jgi:hypothetical protein